MSKINDLVTIKKAIKAKDLNALERGETLVVSGDTKLYAAIAPSQGSKFIAYLEFPAGKPRGNQYHLEKTEIQTVIKGEIKAEFQIYDQPEEKLDIVLQVGDIVEIKPGVAHTFTAIGETAITIENSPQEFMNSDVYRSK